MQAPSCSHCAFWWAKAHVRLCACAAHSTHSLTDQWEMCGEWVRRVSDKCKSACQEKKIRLAHKMYTGKRHRSVQLDDDDDDDDGNASSRKKTKKRSRKKQTQAATATHCILNALALSLVQRMHRLKEKTWILIVRVHTQLKHQYQHKYRFPSRCTTGKKLFSYDKFSLMPNNDRKNEISNPFLIQNVFLCAAGKIPILMHRWIKNRWMHIQNDRFFLPLLNVLPEWIFSANSNGKQCTTEWKHFFHFDSIKFT